MYLGSADNIRIESDDQGFELWVETEEGTWHFNIQGVAEKLYDSVRAEIGPWLRERDDALAIGRDQWHTAWDIDRAIRDPDHRDAFEVFTEEDR